MQVSGQHARIEGVQQESGGDNSWWAIGKQKRPAARYYITDLQSTNGTFINRYPLTSTTQSAFKKASKLFCRVLKNDQPSCGLAYKEMCIYAILSVLCIKWS